MFCLVNHVDSDLIFFLNPVKTWKTIFYTTGYESDISESYRNSLRSYCVSNVVRPSELHKSARFTIFEEIK